MSTDFDSLGSDAGQFILVASEAKYEQLRKERNWMEYLASRLLSASPLLRFLFGGQLHRPGSDQSKGGSQDEIPFPHLPPEEAIRRFKFDLGHPQDGTLYVQNPCNLKHYLLPALADERMVQEKVAAFIEICSALGARKLELLSGSLDSTVSAAKASLKLAAVQAGLSASFRDEYSLDRQILMEFLVPPDLPHLPEKSEPWLTQDPLLRAFVSTRLLQRLHKAKVSLKLSESLVIAAEASGMLKGLGINTGGDYKRVSSTTWDFEIEFWPWPEQEEAVAEVSAPQRNHPRTILGSLASVLRAWFMKWFR